MKAKHSQKGHKIPLRNSDSLLKVQHKFNVKKFSCISHIVFWSFCQTLVARFVSAAECLWGKGLDMHQNDDIIIIFSLTKSKRDLGWIH